MTKEQYDYISDNNINIYFDFKTDVVSVSIYVQRWPYWSWDYYQYKRNFEWSSYEEYIKFIQDWLNWFDKATTIANSEILRSKK